MFIGPKDHLPCLPEDLLLVPSRFARPYFVVVEVGESPVPVERDLAPSLQVFGK